MMEEVKAAGAILGSLKTAGEMAKAVLDMKMAVSEQGKVLDLQRAIIAAHTGALELLDQHREMRSKVDALQEEVDELRRWEVEAKDWHLVRLTNSAVRVYQEAEKTDGDKYNLSLCPDCFSRKHKSVLQLETRNPGRKTYFVCAQCPTELVVSGMRVAEHRAPMRPARR